MRGRESVDLAGASDSGAVVKGRSRGAVGEEASVT